MQADAGPRRGRIGKELSITIIKRRRQRKTVGEARQVALRQNQEKEGRERREIETRSKKEESRVEEEVLVGQT